MENHCSPDPSECFPIRYQLYMPSIEQELVKASDSCCYANFDFTCNCWQLLLHVVLCECQLFMTADGALTRNSVLHEMKNRCYSLLIVCNIILSQRAQKASSFIGLWLRFHERNGRRPNSRNSGAPRLLRASRFKTQLRDVHRLHNVGQKVCPHDQCQRNPPWSHQLWRKFGNGGPSHSWPAPTVSQRDPMALLFHASMPNIGPAVTRTSRACVCVFPENRQMCLLSGPSRQSQLVWQTQSGIRVLQRNHCKAHDVGLLGQSQPSVQLHWREWFSLIWSQMSKYHLTSSLSHTQKKTTIRSCSIQVGFQKHDSNSLGWKMRLLDFSPLPNNFHYFHRAQAALICILTIKVWFSFLICSPLWWIWFRLQFLNCCACQSDSPPTTRSFSTFAEKKMSGPIFSLVEAYHWWSAGSRQFLLFGLFSQTSSG